MFVVLNDFPPPDIEKAWRDCLCRVECPPSYCCPEFFLEPSWFGKRPFAILAVDRDSVVGVLTGLHEGNQVLSGQQSRPQICVDATADFHAAMDSLARGLLAEASSAKLVTVHSWNWLPLQPFELLGFRQRQMEGNVVLDLTRGPEALFKQLNKKRRTNIRFAIRNGTEIFQAATLEEASAFYQIYLTWRQTARKTIKGEQIPWEVFKHRFEYGKNFRFFLARYSGTVIAGITLRFFSHSLVEYANNSSLDEFLHLRPNDLLVWSAIEWACSQGLSRFSLGGAHRFLREFGGEVVPIYRYRLDRTVLRHHDFQEAFLDMARSGFHMLPYPAQKNVRRLLGKES